MSALKALQSSQMAMIFMQIIRADPLDHERHARLEANVCQERDFSSSTASAEQNIAAAETCYKPDKDHQPWVPLHHANQKTLYFSETIKGVRHGSCEGADHPPTNYTTEVTEESAEQVPTTSSTTEVPGYVSNVDMNSRARQELDGVQVMWKWRAGNSHPWRLLEFVV